MGRGVVLREWKFLMARRWVCDGGRSGFVPAISSTRATTFTGPGAAASGSNGEGPGVA
jgi:hypothetical protein